MVKQQTQQTKRQPKSKKIIVEKKVNPQTTLKFVEGDIQRLIRNLQCYIQIMVEKIRTGEETNEVLQGVLATVDVWQDNQTVQCASLHCSCHICTIMKGIK